MLTCLYWYQPGIYVYMYVSHIYVYNISLHERASLAPGCIRFMFPYGSTATRVYQMYVYMCPYGKIRYVTYLYLLHAIMYVWDNRDAYSIYQWYVIWIGPLSTLFVFALCLVKVDYVDNKQVITYIIFYISYMCMYIWWSYIFMCGAYMCPIVSYICIYICTITCISKVKNQASVRDH